MADAEENQEPQVAEETGKETEVEPQAEIDNAEGQAVNTEEDNQSETQADKPLEEVAKGENTEGVLGNEIRADQNEDQVDAMSKIDDIQFTADKTNEDRVDEDVEEDSSKIKNEDDEKEKESIDNVTNETNDNEKVEEEPEGNNELIAEESQGVLQADGEETANEEPKAETEPATEELDSEKPVEEVAASQEAVGEDQAGEEQAGEEQAGEEQAGEEQAEEEQTGEEQAGVVQAGEEQAEEERAGEEQAGEKQAGEEQTGEEQAGEDQPIDKPDDEDEQKPSEEQLAEQDGETNEIPPDNAATAEDEQVTDRDAQQEEVEDSKEASKTDVAEDEEVTYKEPSGLEEREKSKLSERQVNIVPPDAPSEETTQEGFVHGTTSFPDATYFEGSMENDSISKEEIPSTPHLPSSGRTHTEIEGQMSTSAMNIIWSFGLNRNVPVLNLSDGVREAIMYPCAHVGIMYDYKKNKQFTLQGHLNPITCSAVSHDKRWLVTGDVGPDAMVNIWDTYTGIPIQTMFDPNAAGGVVAVAFTPDSRFLATMTALPVQTLAIWDWTVDGDVPICSADLKPEFGVQNYIYFDPTDPHHLVTNSDSQVLFYHWDEGNMKLYAPPLTDSDFNKPVGRYTQSLFQIGIGRALTATSIGNLVVWDNNRPLSKFMDVNQSADKKPLKIIKVHDKGINVLTTTDMYIVLGDTAGHIKFFDQALRLIYWYQDINVGPCTSISFAYMPEFEPIVGENSVYPSDATKQAKPFIVRNFIVGTAIAVYGNMTTDGSKFKVIHREHDAAVHALASHPKLPIIAIGSYSGLLKVWNYKTRETVASRMFERLHIQTMSFDPKGFFLVVGCTNGALLIVDSVALQDQMVEPYRYAKDAITHIAFSHNSAYFATADAGQTITVFRRNRKEGAICPYTWHGRYRSHYKPIRDLLFDVYLDTNNPKLLSLGEDRMLIEYELSNPGKNHVIPKSEDRIEQSAVPQCMCLYPPITKEHFLFSANDEYKVKCYNSTTKMCRKTVLGPTYGSPISKMVVVPTTGNEAENRFLAYITKDKVGLHLLPASGNPHLSMALIAHPSGVSNIACSYDGAYIFTAGGPDYAVHMWEINIPALEAQAKLGGEGLIPFYGLLEGGKDGDMFSELEDFFYYAQLRHQGINSMETREIGNRVPITEVPYLMRAMGFYPSEQEIEDMLNEIKYDDFVHSGQYQVDIDLGQFIKLYVNHRPAFGLAPDNLLWAFKTLADAPELGKGGIIERGDLLDVLQKRGEHMTEIELAEHLTTLLGFNKEGGSCEQEHFDAEQAGNFIAENLPYDINAEIMVNEILGFSVTNDPPILDERMDVLRSEAA